MGKSGKSKPTFRIIDTGAYVCPHCQTQNQYAMAECRVCGAPPPQLQAQRVRQKQLGDIGSGWMEVGTLFIGFGVAESLFLGVHSVRRHDDEVALGALVLFFALAYCIDPARRRSPGAFVTAALLTVSLSVVVFALGFWLHALFPFGSSCALFAAARQAMRREGILSQKL